MICPWKLFFSGNISSQKNLQQIKKIWKNTKSLSRGSILFNLTISTRFDGAYMMKAQSAKHNLASTNELLRFNTHHQIRLNNAVTIGSVSSLIMLLSLNCVGQPQKKLDTRFADGLCQSLNVLLWTKCQRNFYSTNRGSYNQPLQNYIRPSFDHPKMPKIL